MSAPDDPPPITDLEARARWHLGAFADDVAPEPDDREFEDDDGELCPDCHRIWDMCRCHVGDDCGRWRNGRLSGSCSKAGSEECDFECPYRATLYL